MTEIGYQHGIHAAKARMYKLDPGGFKPDGTGAWDKFFRSMEILVHDHDAATEQPSPPPVQPPTQPPPTQTYKKVAPRVAFKQGSSDARYCCQEQPGVERSGNGWRDESGATYDENGLCANGVRSGSPAVVGALEIDGRNYCDLPRIGNPTANTGSWAI